MTNAASAQQFAVKTPRKWLGHFMGAALVFGGGLGEYAIRQPSNEQGLNERKIFDAEMKAADKILSATQTRLIQTTDTLHASYKAGRAKPPETVPPEIEEVLNERNNNQAAIARIQVAWEKAGKTCITDPGSAYCRGRRGEAVEASSTLFQKFLTTVSGYYGPVRNAVLGWPAVAIKTLKR